MKQTFILICLLCLNRICYAHTINFLSKNALLKAILNDMIFVKGGSFHIGDSKHQKMYPNATVTLDSYYLDKYATPWYQYKSYLKLLHKPIPTYHNEGDYLISGYFPVSTTYHDAIAFCQWIGQQTHLPITLVTDAQWEYAARSRGKHVEYATNDGTLKPGVNFPSAASYRFPIKHTVAKPNGIVWSFNSTKVNAFPSNPLGMYAMTGNGAEWVKGYWATLPIKPVNNPQNNSGKLHALRGTGISAVTTALDPKTPKKERLWHLSHINIYSRIFATTPTMTFHFRCAINTAKHIR